MNYKGNYKPSPHGSLFSSSFWPLLSCLWFFYLVVLFLAILTYIDIDIDIDIDICT